MADDVAKLGLEVDSKSLEQGTDKLKEFAEYRRAVMARFAASGMKSSAIFGHVAFSKAAGFDSDYARQR